MDLKTTEALIDGRCGLLVALALVGGGGPMVVISGNILVFILGN